MSFTKQASPLLRSTETRKCMMQNINMAKMCKHIQYTTHHRETETCQSVFWLGCLQFLVALC